MDFLNNTTPSNELPLNFLDCLNISEKNDPTPTGKVSKQVFLFASREEFQAGRKDLYDAKTFYAERKFSKSDEKGPTIDDDNVLAFLLSQVEGEKPVLHAHQDIEPSLLERDLNIHYDNQGSQVVQTLSSRNFTVKAMDDQEYKRIFSAASQALTNLSNQYQEHEKKSDEKGSILAGRNLTLQTGDKEKQLQIADKFPTFIPRSDPQSAAKIEQHLDDLAAEEKKTREEHTKKRGKNWEQRQDYHLEKDKKLQETNDP